MKNILNKFPIFSSPTTTKLLLGTLALLMTTRILTVHGRPSSRCVFTFLVKIAPLKSTAAHCGFKWVKYARNKFTWCNFTSISKQYSADICHFRFRFLCTSHSKLVKLLQTQVWPLNFTNFSNVIFGGFLQFVPNVWLYATALHCTGNDLFLPECSIARGSVCCFYGLSQFERAGPPKTFFFESLKNGW